MSGHLSQAENHDFICNLHNFIQLMGDQDNAFARITEFYQGLEKLDNFLGSEDCGRLVHNQQVSSQIQSFQNFYPLLNTDRNILYQSFGRNLQFILFAKGIYHLFCFFDVQQLILFLNRPPQDHILCYRQGRDQGKMLMNHSDSRINGVLGAFKMHRPAIDEDLSSIRLIHSVEHSHQRSFPGAVFSDQTIDFSGFNGEVYLGVGCQCSKYFGNISQLNLFDDNHLPVFMYFPVPALHRS